MAKKTTKAKPAAAPPQAENGIDTRNMKWWRQVAQAVIPKEQDDWHLGEFAVTMKLFSDVLGKEWDKASRIGDKTENQTVAANVSIKIDRKETPPTVRVSLGFSEKHKASAESDVPDPNQTELPGISEPHAKGEMKVKPGTEEESSDLPQSIG